MEPRSPTSMSRTNSGKLGELPHFKKSKSRPLGIKFITAYLCLRALLLVVVSIFAYLTPESRPQCNRFISHLIPMVLRLHALDFAFILAPLFSFVEAVAGIGIWMLKRWARTIIVLELSYLAVRIGVGLVALAAFDRRDFDTLKPSPYFIIEALACLIMLGCLLDPDVKSAFGINGGDSD